MAECLAARLAAQEEQIRRLTQEISTLRDGLSGDWDIVGDSPLLETLRTDNDRLRYRLAHLRRALQAELGQEVKTRTASEEDESNAGGEAIGGGTQVTEAAAGGGGPGLSAGSRNNPHITWPGSLAPLML